MTLAGVWALARSAAASWQYIVIGLLVVALGAQTLRLSWAKNALIADRAAQAEAVRLQAAKAESLSNELIIAQAAAMAITERTSVEYVDRIKTVRVPTECPADERDRLGSRGVLELLHRNKPAAK